MSDNFLAEIYSFEVFGFNVVHFPSSGIKSFIHLQEENGRLEGWNRIVPPCIPYPALDFCFYFRNSVKDVSSEDRYNVNDLINKTNEYDQNLKEYDIILVTMLFSFLSDRLHISISVVLCSYYPCLSLPEQLWQMLVRVKSLKDNISPQEGDPISR